jgi:hypothetical protein
MKVQFAMFIDGSNSIPVHICHHERNEAQNALVRIGLKKRQIIQELLIPDTRKWVDNQI